MRFSKTISVNTGAEYMFRAKAFFKASGGWTVPRSSDGITMSLVADVITHAGAGAGGMKNDRAWFVLRDPSGRREYCFQRGVSNTAWRITFSEMAKFIIGAPSATVVPSASDSVLLHSSGTDAAPIFSTYLIVDGSYRLQICVDPIPLSSGVYTAWFGANAIGTPNSQTLFMAEALKEYDPGDISPIVHYVRYNPTAGMIFDFTKFGTAAVAPADTFTGWYKYGLSGALYLPLNAGSYGVQNIGYPIYTGNGSIGDWPISGKKGGISVFICRLAGSPTFPKGVTAHVRHAFTPSEFPDVINFEEGDPYVYWGQRSAGGGVALLLPWGNERAGA